MTTTHNLSHGIEAEHSISFTVNGRFVNVVVPPIMRLSRVLREEHEGGLRRRGLRRLYRAPRERACLFVLGRSRTD
jgi:hypothetical protein